MIDPDIPTSSESEPPPSRLTLLYDFLNSTDERSFARYGRRHRPADQFESEEGLEAFLRAHGLLDDGVHVGRREVRRARALRGSLRDAIGTASAPSRSEPLALPMGLGWSSAGDPVIAPLSAGAVAGALAAVALQAAGAVATGDWPRIKMCAADDCRWIFYDRSKPQTRRWCATDVCGNRAKTATYRARHA